MHTSTVEIPLALAKLHNLIDEQYEKLNSEPFGASSTHQLVWRQAALEAMVQALIQLNAHTAVADERILQLTHQVSVLTQQVQQLEQLLRIIESPYEHRTINCSGSEN